MSQPVVGRIAYGPKQEPDPTIPFIARANALARENAQLTRDLAAARREAAQLRDKVRKLLGCLTLIWKIVHRRPRHLEVVVSAVIQALEEEGITPAG